MHRQNVGSVDDADFLLAIQLKIFHRDRVLKMLDDDAGVESVNTGIRDQRRPIRFVRKIKSRYSEAVARYDRDIFQRAIVIGVILDPNRAGIPRAAIDGESMKPVRNRTSVHTLIRSRATSDAAGCNDGLRVFRVLKSRTSITKNNFRFVAPFALHSQKTRPLHCIGNQIRSCRKMQNVGRPGRLMVGQRSKCILNRECVVDNSVTDCTEVPFDAQVPSVFWEDAIRVIERDLTEFVRCCSQKKCFRKRSINDAGGIDKSVELVVYPKLQPFRQRLIQFVSGLLPMIEIHRNHHSISVVDECQVSPANRLL